MSGAAQDSVKKFAKDVGPWLVLAAVFAAAPLVFSSGLSLTMMSVMGVMIIFALSYNMLLGQTGLLSFGHAVYYGLGGFVALHAMNAVIRNKLGIPVPVIPLAGGLAGLFFGFLFGLVSVKRAGIVFAMISLGIGELVSSSSFILRSFFGGEEGITTNRTKLAAFFGHRFGPQIEVYYLVAVWCFVCIVAMYALTRTPFGQMCNAVRENAERVEFVGYSPRRIRFIAFCFAAFFAGIAGALAAINFEIMNAASLGTLQSGLVLFMTFVGGIGYFFGPALGAILISFLQTMLSDVTGAWQLYFGQFFILIVLFSPGGIAGWIALHGEAARRGELLHLAPSYGLVAVPIAAGVCGDILLIELARRILVTAQTEGTRMAFFGIGLDAGAVWPWLAALVLFGGGIHFVMLFWPRVEAAWTDIHLQRQKRNVTA
jgi:branched-chain amino acid transport system permease protein